MIIVNLTGGLGNQMFQYAIGRRLSLRHDVTLGIHTSFYDRHDHRTPTLFKHNIAGERVTEEELFDTLRYPRISRWMQEGKELIPTPSGGWKANLYYFPRFFPEFTAETFNYYREKLEADEWVTSEWPRRQRFHPRIMECGEDAYLHGYWITPKYFEEVAQIVRDDLTISEAVPKSNEPYLSSIQSNTAVSIHVRRGDKAEGDSVTLPIEYYQRSIDVILSHSEDPTFFVFSDDIPWAKNNIDINQESVFVSENDEETDYLDLHLMRNCDHHIIANSTFSWWGAYLNDDENKIVTVPDPWPGVKWPHDSIRETDTIPNDWQYIQY